MAMPATRASPRDPRWQAKAQSAKLHAPRQTSGPADIPDGSLQDLIELAKLTSAPRSNISPGYQTAVRLSKDSASWHGESPLQIQCGRCAHQSVYDTGTVAGGDVNNGLMCSSALI